MFVHFRLMCRLLGNMSSTSDIQLLTQQFAYSKCSIKYCHSPTMNWMIITTTFPLLGNSLIFFFFFLLELCGMWNIRELNYLSMFGNLRPEIKNRLCSHTRFSIPALPPISSRTLNMLFNPPEPHFPLIWTHADYSQLPVCWGLNKRSPELSWCLNK